MVVKKYLLQLKSKKDIEYVNIEWHLDEANDAVKLLLELNGEKIELSDESTENTLKKLTTLLNDKYKIQSCFTCRYGNFCPVGDRDNEIFCINDFEPKSKEDVYFPTENAEERKKRGRTLFDICTEFKPCSEDYYTYK